MRCTVGKTNEIIERLALLFPPHRINENVLRKSRGDMQRVQLPNPLKAVQHFGSDACVCYALPVSATFCMGMASLWYKVVCTSSEWPLAAFCWLVDPHCHSSRPSRRFSVCRRTDRNTRQPLPCGAMYLIPMEATWKQRIKAVQGRNIISCSTGPARYPCSSVDGSMYCEANV